MKYCGNANPSRTARLRQSAISTTKPALHQHWDRTNQRCLVTVVLSLAHTKTPRKGADRDLNAIRPEMLSRSRSAMLCTC